MRGSGTAQTARHSAPPTLALAVRAAAGDGDAFAALYEAWCDRLFALARAATRRDEAFCLDVVHDCVLRVTDRLPALANEDALAAWLTRTLLRVAVDRLRQDARRARREHAVAAQRPPSCELDAELLDREARAWLRARLDELPAADRALLLARFDGGLTLHAAGAGAGISGDAAHGRIRRLILRLRAAAKGAFDV